MTGSVLNMAVTLCGGLGLLGGTLGLLGAGRADAASLAVAGNASAAAAATQQQNDRTPVAIRAEDQRETNLQKTATSITVAGLDEAKRPRSLR